LESNERSGVNCLDIKLNMQIDQKTLLMLSLIKDKFGGEIEYRKDTYSYSSTSFDSARKVIDYLDKYHLLSSKHVDYLRWRKTYILVQSENYLTPRGRGKIKKLALHL